MAALPLKKPTNLHGQLNIIASILELPNGEGGRILAALSGGELHVLPVLSRRRVKSRRPGACAVAKSLKRTALGLALVAGLAVAADAGHGYWKVGRFLQSTTNAYVRADYTIVSPKISGHITEVLVQDNESVTAGHVVARVDDRDFKVALAQARADVASDDAELSNLDAQIAQQQSAIDQEKAEHRQRQASLSYAQADNVRYGNLKKSGYGTVQRAEKAETAMRQKTAQLLQSRAGLLMAQRKIDMLASERAKAQAQRERSLAALHQAELNLSYTQIAAPVDGHGRRPLASGRPVRPGRHAADGGGAARRRLSSWPTTRRPSSPTCAPASRSRSRSIPSRASSLKSHIDSVSPASGLEFALLPADNATGNFTKIVQRVPVKIVLDDKALAGRLRPGMSVEATVDTRARN